jgi:hypothetical protein
VVNPRKRIGETADFFEMRTADEESDDAGEQEGHEEFEGKALGGVVALTLMELQEERAEVETLLALARLSACRLGFGDGQLAGHLTAAGHVMVAGFDLPFDARTNRYVVNQGEIFITNPPYWGRPDSSAPRAATIWPTTVGSTDEACSHPIRSRHSNALLTKSSECPLLANARSVSAASRASARAAGARPAPIPVSRVRSAASRWRTFVQRRSQRFRTAPSGRLPRGARSLRGA